nr:putative late blight resistance protein homolog R1B-16 isoform X2 [Ipomoea trifida]
MAYAAVTSLMETLSLHFLQSQPGLPLEDLEAQIRDGNENLGLLQQILEIGNDDTGAMKYAEYAKDEMREMGLDEASSSKGVHGIFNNEASSKRLGIKACLPRSGDKPSFDKSHSLHSRLDYSRGFYFHVLDELLSHLKLLRVVDIECGHCNTTCEVIVFTIPVHLRYFALTYPSRDDRSSLYVKFFEHRNMQSFIVRGRFVTWDSSSAFTIWAMPLLRNFCVEQILSLETSSVVHRNLENISWLDPKLCTQDLFTRIPNVKKLGIEGGDDESPDCFNNLVHLRQLEALSIRRWYYLERISCSGIPWATSFLPNLKRLKFIDTNLAWSDMRLIGMLPNLEVLKLIHACRGRKWETSEGGFRQLKRLVIKDRSLKDWNAEGDHFRMLECLELHECTDLQKIPSGFVDITTLALIELNYCEDSLLTSAKWIQDEQLNNYGNSILVRSRKY